MIIHTLWGARRGESTPELMAAWDEYSVDENREGFVEDCERAIKSWGDDLQEKRYIDLNVSEGAIIAAFGDVAIDASVHNAR